MRKILLSILILLICSSANATVYYVRTDGGTTTQCTGTTNAAYPGSGTGQACAFIHPAWALGATGTSGVVSSGDDVQFGDIGPYMIGYGMPNTSGCSAANSRNCVLDTVPDGVDLFGYNYSSCDSTAVTSKTQLWGTEKVDHVLQIGSSTTVECLNITDHSPCIYSGPYDGNIGGAPVQCSNNTPPYGDWAYYGILSSDSTSVTLNNVDIHGLAHSGIFGIHLGTWNVNNSNIVTSGWVGWDSDGPAADDSYTGTITLDNTHIDWNGCGEVYPITDTDLTSSTDKHHCWSQDQGGFGDGIGLGDGQPGNWTVLNSSISHNTSDGLDLLHGNGTGNTIVRRSVMEGNAGQQVKVTTSALIENSKIIGNCGFFSGQSFTSTVGSITYQSGCELYGFTWDGTKCLVNFNNCRAAGNTISTQLGPGRYFKLYGSTVYSNGDVAIEMKGNGCDGTTGFEVKNSILLGGIEFNDGSDHPAYLYQAEGTNGCQSQALDTQYSQVNGMKNSYQPPGTGNIYTEPEFTASPVSNNYQGLALDVTLTANSDARDAASESIAQTSVDFNGWARGGSWDMGAYEYDTQGGGTSCNDDCSACSNQSACQASTFPCYYWTNNTCQSSAETCDDNCAACGSSVACSGSAQTCYWWSTSSCEINPEPCSTTCVGCTTQNSCETIIDAASSCIGGWNLNENAANNTVSDGCSTNNGNAYSTNTLINTSTIAVNGLINGAFSFNGTTTNVSMGDVLDLTKSDIFSIEAWFKHTGTGEQNIVGKMNTGTGYVLQANNGAIDFYFGNYLASDMIFASTGDINADDGNWHHVVVTHDGTGTFAGIHIYVDNVDKSLSNTGGVSTISASYNTAAHFSIGSRRNSPSSAEKFLNGTIDNVKVYDIELTSGNVSTLYNSGAGLESVFDATQQCYWWSDSSCNTTVESACDSSCASCDNQTLCEASAATCYWYSATCNSSPQSPPNAQSNTFSGGSLSGSFP